MSNLLYVTYTMLFVYLSYLLVPQQGDYERQNGLSGVPARNHDHGWQIVFVLYDHLVSRIAYDDDVGHEHMKRHNPKVQNDGRSHSIFVDRYSNLQFNEIKISHYFYL